MIQTGLWTGICKVSRLCHWYLTGLQAGTGFVSTRKYSIQLLYLYVCVCICIHIYVYACMRVHMCICVCIYTSPYVFLRRVYMHLQVLLSTMHVQVCTLDRCCEHQRTHLLHARYKVCICAMYTHVLIPRFERIDPRSRVLNYFL